jgi:2,4-dichlorophenol 6-monooxygenase
MPETAKSVLENVSRTPLVSERPEEPEKGGHVSTTPQQARSDHVRATGAVVDTDVLVVGTGPAGGAASALLATYGIDSIVINKFGWTARTPRAHITNQRTMEILRDLGIEDRAVALATPRELMGQNTYCTSLAGQELGRIRTWGTHPARTAEHDLASPTKMCDLPQNLLEPILVDTAASRGGLVRFHTEYLGHVQDDSGVTSSVRDTVTGAVYSIRSRYLLGADGANSLVAQDLDLPIEGAMGVSGSINIVFTADLTRYVAHRPSTLYWVIQPGSDQGGLGIGVVRAVRPWYKWLAIWNYDVTDGPPRIDEPEAVRIVRSLVGDADLDVDVEATSTWTVNNAYARELSRGRVFCLGDAIHRHPPTNGLGSNVSIADAYNLAWKLAYVIRGQASPALLDTYNVERAPIAAETVTRANKSLAHFPEILSSLELLDTTNPDRLRDNVDRLTHTDSNSASRRQALRQAIDASEYVYNTHGVEMNQRYRSRAIVEDGTAEPDWARDHELYFQPSSRPGALLPHAWLDRGGEAVSTHDLCGSGRFVLLTGNAGTIWREAVEKAAADLGVEVIVRVIGPGQLISDPFGEFAAIRDTDESGCLLVRPDRIIGWRRKNFDDHAAGELSEALKAILGVTA